MRRTVLVAVLAALVGALVAAPVAVYASHQFTDVADSNIFHADIDWLADTGITRGCNPPANDRFCPDDNVTREQLAAFLHRFAKSGLGFDSDRIYANWARNDVQESDQIRVSCDKGDVLLSGDTILSSRLIERGFEYVDGPTPVPADLWTIPDPYPNVGPRFRVDSPFTGWEARVARLPEFGNWAVVAYCYDVA